MLHVANIRGYIRVQVKKSVVKSSSPFSNSDERKAGFVVWETSPKSSKSGKTGGCPVEIRDLLAAVNPNSAAMRIIISACLFAIAR